MNDDLEPIPEGARDPRRVKAEAENNGDLIEILENESIHPAWKVGLMFLCCGGLLVFTILKGGGDINPLDLQCGEFLYWTITLAAIPWVTIYICRLNQVKDTVRSSAFMKKRGNGRQA